jgi:hypothetical protein
MSHHSLLRRCAPQPCRLASRLLATASARRPDLADVERLTRGEAAKRRGTGSRDVPHRLNQPERAAWDLAKQRGFVTLSGTGYRRERKGSPLANSWRMYCDALAVPAVELQLGDGSVDKLDRLVVDLSTLRSAAGAATTRVTVLELGQAAGARLAVDVEEAAMAGADSVDSAEFATWQLSSLLLELELFDRPAARALASSLAVALVGTTGEAVKRRAKEVKPPRDEEE